MAQAEGTSGVWHKATQNPDKTIVCYDTGNVCWAPGVTQGQVLAPLFLEPRNRGTFFDDALADATRKLNAAYDEVWRSYEKEQRAQGRSLSILRTDRGLLLAWVTEGTADDAAGGVDFDDSEAIAEALGI